MYNDVTADHHRKTQKEYKGSQQSTSEMMLQSIKSQMSSWINAEGTFVRTQPAYYNYQPFFETGSR